ncbi:hypothetical protein BCY88_35100 [Paraburkholderia fungorum]|uniref:Uncharacterized protein n=1 Tax=Paraburkholderia fungorum TaxID=134537 RepID=A0A3R7L871_9BURK|nr:hypothetical protein BCY88_35100 [Paraburkholderia fungorum]
MFLLDFLFYDRAADEARRLASATANGVTLTETWGCAEIGDNPGVLIWRAPCWMQATGRRSRRLNRLGLNRRSPAAGRPQPVARFPAAQAHKR